MINKVPSHPTVNEVYFYVIDLTVEALKKYLQKTEKQMSKYDIPNELKIRWQARINCLFHSLEGSWSKFQEYSNKYNECITKNDILISSSTIVQFPLVCTLSWDILKQFRKKNEKISGFKSWVWNCLVSHVVSEGVCPQHAYILNYKKNISFQKIQKQINLKNQTKYKKDIFNRYELIIFENFNMSKHNKNNVIQINKKNVIIHDSESLGSELDKDIESQIIEENEENIPSNFVLAIAEKVYRRNTKWRVFLKNGILHVNGKDLLFNLCKCEFFW
jgi:hypothetical protein